MLEYLRVGFILVFRTQKRFVSQLKNFDIAPSIPLGPFLNLVPDVEKLNTVLDVPFRSDDEVNKYTQEATATTLKVTYYFETRSAFSIRS